MCLCARCRSRNSENNTGKFPDIVAALPGLLREGTQSVVLDCEAVGFERATGRILPFQAGHPCRPKTSFPVCMRARISFCCEDPSCPHHWQRMRMLHARVLPGGSWSCMIAGDGLRASCNVLVMKGTICRLG